MEYNIDKKKCSYCGHYHSSIIVNRIADLFPPKREPYPGSILICDYCLDGLVVGKISKETRGGSKYREPIQLPLAF